MLDGRPTLLAALSLAADAVGPAADVIPAHDDPLRLDLPALQPSPADFPPPATVRVFAALYLAAELEQAGIVPIAELLAEHRYSFDVTTYQAAKKLDDFASRSHQWYDRAGRIQLYARLFGIGPAATNDAGTLVNREFVPLLASLCGALVRSTDAGGGSASAEAGVRLAVEALLGNIAPRALANTLLAARRLEDQIHHAVEILRDPAVGAVVGARTLQETIVNILGKDAPDVQRLIDTGLAGQRVLEWVASALPRLTATTTVPLVAAGDPVGVSATLWLHAAGVTQPQQAAA
jgi:hypothetical protein